MAQSELECFSGVKTAQNSKAESGIEREKEAEGRCAWGDFTSRKTGRMHRETLQRWLLCRGAKTTVQKKKVMSLVFYKMPDQGSS